MKLLPVNNNGISTQPGFHCLLGQRNSNLFEVIILLYCYNIKFIHTYIYTCMCVFICMYVLLFGEELGRAASYVLHSCVSSTLPDSFCSCVYNARDEVPFDPSSFQLL